MILLRRTTRRKGTYAKYMYTKGDSPLWTDYKVNSILNNDVYRYFCVWEKPLWKEIWFPTQEDASPIGMEADTRNHHEAIAFKGKHEKVQAMEGTLREAFTPVGKKGISLIPKS